ncbi:DUF2911 domain-containing protein [Gemmatimonas sp.]|uniref:DUF2911 domain-containing protein n=1 Tax=Gemmatimonas sp. TaxID=1962908 RepID=UPI0031C75116|nr:DUF2911 domain-containing protein [Gemmatimonas sp.]
MTISRSLLRGATAFAAVSLLSVSAAAQGSMGGMQMGGAQKAPASPRDSLKTTVAGSEISVNYGRPSKRGRVLFNGLGDMKWGMVWRTGANEATHFTTSKALDFGGKVVPAGTYTLWTQLEENGKWQLIVNKQTKQWGTAYDAKQDLLRVPLMVTSNNAVVEKMEIQVKPAGKGGEIAIMWDTYKAVAGFVVK